MGRFSVAFLLALDFLTTEKANLLSMGRGHGGARGSASKVGDKRQCFQVNSQWVRTRARQVTEW